MPQDAKTLIALERKFWQSMVDQDTDTALGLLAEPALMVSAHGAMRFDHAGYRKMAEQGNMMLEEMNDTSTWVKVGGDWKCVMHTETPAAKPH